MELKACWLWLASSVGLAGACPRPASPPLPPLTGKAALDAISCLATAREARIHVQFGVRGDFGGSDNLLDAEIRTGSDASVTGALWTGRGRAKKVRLAHAAVADTR